MRKRSLIQQDTAKCFSFFSLNDRRENFIFGSLKIKLSSLLLRYAHVINSQSAILKEEKISNLSAISRAMVCRDEIEAHFFNF
jgi:hypothetical protein